MKYRRILDLRELVKKKSFFLFGPRATGKTCLIREQLAGRAYVVDLLKAEYFLRLSQNPDELIAMVQSKAAAGKIIVIDEVQKIPALLDCVHHLIEQQRCHFLLTGSSARKLKRGQANLLAGRAWSSALFPLCFAEIDDMDLDHYLRFGGLPAVYGSADPEEELDAYVQTYLKEEILAEGLIRKLAPFSRFLKVAALNNSQQINFNSIASDCQVSPSTVREHYTILEDTLLGFVLEPWGYSKKRKAVQTAKFYFFDTGVVHTLAGTRTLDRNSDLYGRSFEHFIAMELRAYLSYRRRREEFGFWRSVQGHEVDFVIGKDTAIEVKAARKVAPSHLDGLKTLREEGIIKKFYLVTQDSIEGRRDGVECLFWRVFLERLWQDEIF